jgi:hypothetical protein
MSNAMIILRMIGPEAKASVPLLREILRDRNQKTSLRTEAANALAEIKPEDSQTVSILLDIFKIEKSTDLLSSSAYALAANAKNNSEALNVLLKLIDDPLGNDIVKADAIYAITENPDFAEEKGQLQLNKLCLNTIEDSSQGSGVVAACVSTLGSLNGIRISTVDNILQLTNKNDTKINGQIIDALAKFSKDLYQNSITLQQVSENRKVVEKIQSKIIQIDPENKSGISETISAFDIKEKSLWKENIQKWLFGSRAFWVFHPLIWIGLIFAYPKSRQIQAFFFWNKRVRAVLGCGYVGPLISAVPPLRQRLFAPFKDSLIERQLTCPVDDN